MQNIDTYIRNAMANRGEKFYAMLGSNRWRDPSKVFYSSSGCSDPSPVAVSLP
jgi:hypothetical protein